MPAVQAQACMYSPSATNSTENPRQARMQVRQPPHQSIGPYLLPEVTRCTATDVVAIFMLLLSLVRGCPRTDRGVLHVDLADSRRQEHGAAFDATSVQLVQDVGGVFEGELLSGDLNFALAVELHQLGQVVVRADDVADDGVFAQQQVDGLDRQASAIANLGV